MTLTGRNGKYGLDDAPLDLPFNQPVRSMQQVIIEGRAEEVAGAVAGGGGVDQVVKRVGIGAEVQQLALVSGAQIELPSVRHNRTPGQGEHPVDFPASQVPVLHLRVDAVPLDEHVVIVQGFFSLEDR